MTSIESLFPAVDDLFATYAADQHMPGLAYGVVLDGELVYARATGVASVATGAPVTNATVFRIASMTKSFTALAVLQLRDTGHVRLDEPAATYVPELANLLYPTADSAPITVRQLLTMAPGWPQDDPWADRQLYRPDADLSEFYRQGIPFANPPGVTFEYSNMAYMVLGRIVTNVSGMPAMDTIDRHILAPLGMTATVWQAADVPAAYLAHGHRWEDDAWRAEELLPCGGDVAAFAGLYLNLPDLARWVGLFQAAWPPRDEVAGGPLRPSSLREMQQIGTFIGAELTGLGLGRAPRPGAFGYGFGLSMHHNGAWISVGHGGGVPGFGSHMRWSPEHGLGVIALANVTYANVHAACSEALELLVERAALSPRPIHPSAALEAARERINRLLDHWDDGLADTLFADNFFLDLDRTRWQRRLAELQQCHGRLRPAGDLAPENWLRGQWRMAGERGHCTVWLSLAPTMPPRVQALRIESVLPPAPAMEAAAGALAALTAHPTRRALDRLRSPASDRGVLWDQVRLLNILCGPCRVDAWLANDGKGQGTARLVGAKGAVDASLRLDVRGKLAELTCGPVEAPSRLSERGMIDRG